MTTAAELDLSSLDKDPRLFLYTSLTAGSSHIVTATSRMETILKANRIPFLAVDIATDEKCRRLWQRRGGAKKKLPGLVKEGYIIGVCSRAVGAEVWSTDTRCRTWRKWKSGMSLGEFPEIRDQIPEIRDQRSRIRDQRKSKRMSVAISVMS